MSDPRAAIFAFLRPYLKGNGWNDKALREGMDMHLDRLGAPKGLKLSSGPTEPDRPEIVSRGTKGALTAIIGAVAATSLFASIPKEEGTRLAAYRDIVGVTTICSGDTKNVRMGMVETPEGCRVRLETQLASFASAVMRCSPTLSEDGRDWPRAAAVSLAYNIGVAGYCRSTVDRRFDAGDFRGGCDAFLMWSKAGGRVVRGLALRRERERQVCLKGVA